MANLFPGGDVTEELKATWTFTNKTNNTQVKFETNKGVVKYANGGQEVTFTIDDTGTGINNPYLKITMVDGTGYKMIITSEDNEYVLPHGSKEEIEDAATGITLYNFPAEDGHFEITLEKAVQDVKERGMYINGKLVSTIQMDSKNVVSIRKSNGKILWEADTTDYFYIQAAQYSTSAINLTIDAQGTPLQSKLEYSQNKAVWETLTIEPNGTYKITIPAGGRKMYFRSSGYTYSNTGYIQITGDKAHYAGGNLFSLLNYTKLDTLTSLPKNAFNSLFSYNKYLIDASALNIGNATTAQDKTFDSMFKGCTGLTEVPSFNTLTTATGGTFNTMYFGCTSLVNPPEFSGLKSISTGFQNTFNGCTKLVKSPDFRGLTSITATTACFNYCFKGCTKLTEVYAPSVAKWNITLFKDWLDGVAATGTLHRSSVSLVIPENSNSGCPTGWTLEPAGEKTTVDIHIQDMQDADSTVTLNEVTKIANSVETLAFENVDTSVSNTLYINRPYKGFTTLYLDGSPLREEDTEREITYSIPANTKGEILVLFDSFT